MFLSEELVCYSLPYVPRKRQLQFVGNEFFLHRAQTFLFRGRWENFFQMDSRDAIIPCLKTPLNSFRFRADGDVTGFYHASLLRPLHEGDSFRRFFSSWRVLVTEQRKITFGCQISLGRIVLNAVPCTVSIPGNPGLAKIALNFSRCRKACKQFPGDRNPVKKSDRKPYLLVSRFSYIDDSMIFKTGKGEMAPGPVV